MHEFLHQLVDDVQRVPDSVPWATAGVGAAINATAWLGLGLTASDFALISTGIACLCAAALSIVKIWCRVAGRGSKGNESRARDGGGAADE